MMTRLLRRPALLAMFAMTTAAGCSLTGPDRDEGRFVLLTVQGEPLPTAVGDFGSVRVVAIADTIVLRDDGTGVRTSVSDYHELISGIPTAAEPNRVNSSTPLTWSSAFGQFEASYLCPPNANCAPGPHMVGTLGDDGLVLLLDRGRAGMARYDRRF